MQQHSCSRDTRLAASMVYLAPLCVAVNAYLCSKGRGVQPTPESEVYVVCGALRALLACALRPGSHGAFGTPATAVALAPSAASCKGVHGLWFAAQHMTAFGYVPNKQACTGMQQGVSF